MDRPSTRMSTSSQLTTFPCGSCLQWCHCVTSCSDRILHAKTILVAKSTQEKALENFIPVPDVHVSDSSVAWLVPALTVHQEHGGVEVGLEKFVAVTGNILSVDVDPHTSLQLTEGHADTVQDINIQNQIIRKKSIGIQITSTNRNEACMQQPMRRLEFC